jgi:hypothetical protein
VTGIYIYFVHQLRLLFFACEVSSKHKHNPHYSFIFYRQSNYYSYYFTDCLITSPNFTRIHTFKCYKRSLANKTLMCREGVWPVVVFIKCVLCVWGWISPFLPPTLSSDIGMRGGGKAVKGYGNLSTSSKGNGWKACVQLIGHADIPHGATVPSCLLVLLAAQGRAQHYGSRQLANHITHPPQSCDLTCTSSDLFTCLGERLEPLPQSM